MRQIWITKSGGTGVLKIRESADPQALPKQLRIRVAYSGVNFADTLARMGLYPDAPKIPCVVGYEVSGVVDAVGLGVDAAWLNKRVMAMTRFNGYSDVVCVPENQVFALSDDVPLEDAAALPVNALTAYQMLIAMGRLNTGDKVLIHGAAGGVGWIAIQIAKILGATVYGTASPQKHADLLALGIDAAIDYRNKDFVKEIKRLTDGAGVELVLDPIGGHHWMRSYRALAPTGRLVIYGAAGVARGKRMNFIQGTRWVLGIPWLRFNPISLMNENKGIIGVNLGHLWDEIPRLRPWAEQILAWYESGELRPRIDNVYPFEEVGAAHDRLQDRENIGKVLLKP